MDCPLELEDDFDRWYDEEHIPKRLAVPGFTAAARFHAEWGGPRHLAVYHTTSPEVFSSAEYAEVKHGLGNTALTRRMLGNVSGFTRYMGLLLADTKAGQEPDIASPWLGLEFFRTSEGCLDELDQWYEGRRLAELGAIAGLKRARLYWVLEAEPELWAMLAMLDFESAPDSQALAVRAAPTWIRQCAQALYRRRASP